MTYPRAMADIIREMVLWQQDTWWLKNKYLRRGRLVEQAASLEAFRKGVADEWWIRKSGSLKCRQCRFLDIESHLTDLWTCRECGADSPITDDYLPHEECRPAVDGAIKFLHETGFQLRDHGLEVTNLVERYVGHLDWLGTFPDRPDEFFIIDLKHGKPPANGPLKEAYRLQTALYAMALAVDRKVIAKRAGLHLYDGTYELVKHTDPRDSALALIAVRGYHLRHKYDEED